MLFLPAPPAFEFRVEPGRGLSVVAGGVPLVRGSYVRIVSGAGKAVEVGKERVEAVDADTVRETFSGADVDGSQTFHREGDRLRVRTEIRWAADSPATAEVAAGLVWAPATERGAKPAPPATETIGGRRLGPDFPDVTIPGPLGPIRASGSASLTAFDGRRFPGLPVPDAVWVGDLALPLERGKTAFLDVEWRIPMVATPTRPPIRRTARNVALTDALLPDEARTTLVPKPGIERLDFDHPIDVTAGWNLPIGPFDHYEEFLAAVGRRFQVPAPGPVARRVNLDGGVSKLGFNPGGYRITIRADRGVTIVGEEDTGLRNVVERLAQLVFLKNGRLYLPTGYLYDDPKVGWRGVHLFGGPEALPFQKALWTRVLRPLGFDHVVLECERTAWDATPGIATPDSMTKAQLGDLFAMYRGLGVDAIPLVQSFGHMDWLFAHGKNLDLALNLEVPYAVDPRKPRTKEVLTKVWDEAIALARPKAVHFGLDEVAMRGWTGGDAFLTDTWRLQLGFLGGLARAHEVDPMLWGDQALYRDEAPDAAFAGTAADAAARRAAIPRGAFVTDWHYKDDPRPETFAPTLQLWKDARTRPIAAGWYRPDNVRGLALAAGELGAGYLQTTWAGYASRESAMLEHPEQFAAMVLAADYAWSGRLEYPRELPYDPLDVLRRLYYGRPSPLTARPGFALSDGAAFRVGSVGFRSLDLRLASVLRPGADAGGEIDLTTDGKGRELDLALATEVAAPAGAPVAEVRVERVGGPPIVARVVYGLDVRALGDPEPLLKTDRAAAGPSLLRLDLGKAATSVTRVVVRPLDTYSGVRLMGATLLP